MSFIERAVEQMRQGASAAKAESADQPAAGRAERRAAPAETPVSTPPPMAARSLQCRNPRTVRIDLPAMREAGVIAPEAEERRIAEEYRIIKRPLLKAMTGEQAQPLSNLLVVTSAVPSEGKTFTSINLALSLAREHNREVILVDGDVAKRHVTHLFGLDDEPGLLDAGIAGGPDVEDVVLRTDNPSLFLLPAGNPHVESTEILRSERTATLLAALASEPRRIVLIDSPPLLVTSEAGVLSSLAGHIVMVVKASETPQQVVEQAIETIPEDKPVSLVLNQVVSMPDRHYGYYGYYGDYGRDKGAAGASTPAADPG
jgi:exopolysaccharide/PEP-CTERM locus tyrosine autokinase